MDSALDLHAISFEVWKNVDIEGICSPVSAMSRQSSSKRAS